MDVGDGKDLKPMGERPDPTAPAPGLGDPSGMLPMHERRFMHEQIIANTHIPIALFSPEGVYLMANQEYLRRFDLEKSDVVGLPARQVLGDARFEAEVLPHLQRGLAGEIVGFEDWLEMTHGHRRFMARHFQPLLAPDGGLKGVVEISYDLTNQKLAEEALRVSEHELWTRNQIAQAFLMAQDDGVYLQVLKIILAAMDAPAGYLGYVDEQGDLAIPASEGGVWPGWESKPAGFLLPASAWQGVLADSLLHGRTVVIDGSDGSSSDHLPFPQVLSVPIIHHDAMIGQMVVAGSVQPFDYNSRKHLESIATQVAPVLKARREHAQHLAERRQLEDQLVSTQKMEAIGTLAGGIAHDFNNILSAIMGFSDLAMDDVEDRPSVHESLTEILHACYRARELVNQILTFSRKTKQERKPMMIQSLIKEIMKLLRGSLPASIEIKAYLDHECPPVLADPSQIHQVVMNLCTNAFQSMRQSASEPAHSERENILTVELKTIEIDKARARELLDLKPGPYVEFIVRDTGEGIAPDILDRIFEPYFSTKRGEGSGLGLAVVQGIVKNHNGAIRVESEVNVGTQFHVFFPVYRSAPVPDGALAQPAAPVSGLERLLFVDDEPAIRDLAQRGLERMGYKVDICSCGEEALALLKSDTTRYQAVITDYTMPRMSGVELTELIKEIKPSLPVLLCSGYSEDKNLESNTLLSAVLKKPLTMKEIARQVRRILDKTE